MKKLLFVSAVVMLFLINGSLSNTTKVLACEAITFNVNTTLMCNGGCVYVTVDNNCCLYSRGFTVYKVRLRDSPFYGNILAEETVSSSTCSESGESYTPICIDLDPSELPKDVWLYVEAWTPNGASLGASAQIKINVSDC